MSGDNMLNEDLLRKMFVMYHSVKIFSSEESLPILEEPCGKSQDYEYTWDGETCLAADRRRTLFYDFSEKNMPRILKFLESPWSFWLGLSYKDENIAAEFGQSLYNEDQAKGILLRREDSQDYSIGSVLDELSKWKKKVTHFLRVEETDYGRESVPGGIDCKSAKIYEVKI